MYVGIDADGSHFVIPVEAKGRAPSEKLTAEQIISNHEATLMQFPDVPCISVAAKVIDDYRIALIRFKVDIKTGSVEKEFERHYVLAANPPKGTKLPPTLTDTEILENVKDKPLSSEGSVTS